MPKAHRRVALLLGALLVAPGCAEGEITGSIRIEIETPLNDDALSEAASIRLRVEPGGPERTWSTSPLAPLDVGFPVDADGRKHSLRVEGLDADGKVVARGISEPLSFHPDSDLVIRVVVRRLDAFSLSADPLRIPRLDAGVVRLVHGAAYVVGGVSGTSATQSVERIDPWLTDITSVAALPEPRRAPAAVATSAGRILVVGGEVSSAVSWAPGEVEWTAHAGANWPATRHPAVIAVGPDAWLVAGGTDKLTGPRDDIWTLTSTGGAPTIAAGAPLRSPRARPFGAAVGDAVLITGDGDTLAELADGTVIEGAPRYWPAIVAVSVNEALIIGGGVPSTSAITWVDLTTGEAQDIATLTHPRSEHSASVLPDGRVLVVGGISAMDSESDNTAEVLVRDGSGWSVQGTLALSVGRTRHHVVDGAHGTLLFVAGLSESGGFAPRLDVFAAP